MVSEAVAEVGKEVGEEEAPEAETAETAVAGLEGVDTAEATVVGGAEREAGGVVGTEAWTEGLAKAAATAVAATAVEGMVEEETGMVEEETGMGE